MDSKGDQPRKGAPSSSTSKKEDSRKEGSASSTGIKSKATTKKKESPSHGVASLKKPATTKSMQTQNGRSAEEAVAQQAFYRTMLAAGRADLVLSSEFAASCPNDVASENPPVFGNNDDKAADNKANLPRPSSATAASAPGAYDEGPGRPSVRLDTSSLARVGVLDNSSDGDKERQHPKSASPMSSNGVIPGNDYSQPTASNRRDSKMGLNECHNGDISDRTSETGFPSSSADDFMAVREMTMDIDMSIPQVEAHAVDEMVEVHAKPIEWWTPRKISLLVMASLVVLAVVIIVTATTLSNQNQNKDGTLAPTLAPTFSPVLRLEMMADIVELGTNASLLEDPSSPQSKALEWLAQDDALRVTEDQVDHTLQRHSLAVLYFSMGGPSNWTDQYEFLLPTHECTWSGALICDEDMVTGIDLTNNNLLGRLPPEVGLLSGLSSLVLDNNELAGPLPSILPPSLQRLDIWNNDLTGSIPTLYGTMKGLESLRVGKNALTGTIPAELGSLTMLTALSLESNRLTGSIPDLWNLTRMRDFQIGQQTLTGTLSPLVGRWTNATVFHVNKLNGITGTIPTELGLLTKLQSLKLSQNHLRGTLPSELGNLNQVSLLAISRNGISGTIPSEFGRLASTEEIYLQNTHMTGDFGSVCNIKEEGGLPLLRTFNADLEEVNCTCCTCCEY